MPDVNVAVKTDFSSSQIVHNSALQRFELLAEDGAAFASYVHEGSRVIFHHTYVPDAFRGKGVAAMLVRAALDEPRRQHWKIVPQCSYVAAFIERNPEYADLVDRQE
jgi:predicted GNAT family acetyltransferase